MYFFIFFYCLLQFFAKAWYQVPGTLVVPGTVCSRNTLFLQGVVVLYLVELNVCTVCYELWRRRIPLATSMCVVSKESVLKE